MSLQSLTRVDSVKLIKLFDFTKIRVCLWVFCVCFRWSGKSIENKLTHNCECASEL